MKLLLTIISSIVYVIALFILAFIVFAPLLGIGIWTNGSSGIGSAIDFGSFPVFRALCLVLLILMLCGGFYFIWLNAGKFLR